MGQGPLRSTIFVKNLVGQTNTLLSKMKVQKGRTVGWSDDSGICYDFEALTEYGEIIWKAFRGVGTEEEPDPNEAHLRESAYGKLYEKFGDDKERFEMELAFVYLANSIPHEFHHKEIIGDRPIRGDVKEASAYLYSMTSNPAPEGQFAILRSMYLMKKEERSSVYGNASKLLMRYLAMAAHSVGDLESLSRKAELALKMMERDYGLPSHEQVERELKPDFRGYSQKLREAIAESIW